MNGKEQTKFRRFKSWLLCTRPFLALQVLRGRSLAYRLEIEGTLRVKNPTKIVGNTFYLPPSKIG